MVAATDAPAVTDTPLPTDTPAPTETPLPTDTPVPTETPIPTETATATSTPTDTPEPTETPTPTETPEPTATPLPPTNTPVPVTNTPVPTATPEETATPDFVVLYYISNPADVLGVFPLRPFDASAMYSNMLLIRNSLGTMRDALPGTKNGDANACSSYVGAYNGILNAGIFYDEVPPEWEDVDGAYVLSFIYALDRTRPAYLSCVDAGRVDEFNHNLALQTIEETLRFISPFIDAAASRLP
ncbi:MAG: hypothetical protein H6650_21440 [Ardenticatenales bacterium]|nr:hypothetical protein [Ardenticatenales bacterium]